MSKFLSQEWLDLQKQLISDAGLGADESCSISVQFLVSAGPDGDVSYVWKIDKGALIENVLGTEKDAGITVTTTWKDAVAIHDGSLNPNVAFMQGRLKVAGDMNTVLKLLPLTASDDYALVQKQLAEATEF